MTVPDPWPALILALSVFRLARLIGWDGITSDLRVRLTRMADTAGTRYVGDGQPRPRLHEFIHCPFCTGFWIALGLYAAWRVWPDATLGACVVLALSAAGGLIAKQLDP